MNDLMAMGFSKELVSAALLKNGNNLDLALEYLLSPQHNEILLEGIFNKNLAALVLEISQYTFGQDGASACTVISASVLKLILNRLGNGNDIRNAELLSAAVMEGVSHFNLLGSHGGHLSVDEIDVGFFDTINMVGAGSLQGLVSNKNPFQTLFSEIRGFCDPEKYIGVIITKTPETVCVVLPPLAGESMSYAVFDSHSRPQFGYDGAYLLTSECERDIADYLTRLFPAIDFDADAGLAQLQYNMFEAYTFQVVA